MKDLIFEEKPKNTIFFDEKPVNLFKSTYLFRWNNDVFKLVNYGEGCYTWINFFNNQHFYLPNGAGETLDEALDRVKHHGIKVFESTDKRGIINFIS